MIRRPRVTLRTGEPSDARRLHALITAAEAEGHLLPRTLAEVTQHVSRFVVAVRNRKSPQQSPNAQTRASLVISFPVHRGCGNLKAPI